jgi:hypothetical protein
MSTAALPMLTISTNSSAADELPPVSTSLTASVADGGGGGEPTTQVRTAWAELS